MLENVSPKVHLSTMMLKIYLVNWSVPAGDRLATNMLETVSFYDVGGCITLDEKIDVQDWQVLILAGNVTMQESVVFKAFVHKDTRTSWATQDVRVSYWYSDFLGIKLNTDRSIVYVITAIFQIINLA